jgi:hypothetical protein
MTEQHARDDDVAKAQDQPPPEPDDAPAAELEPDPDWLDVITGSGAPIEDQDRWPPIEETGKQSD